MSSDARLRLALLMLILVGLLAYAVTQRPWEGPDEEVAVAASSNCPLEEVPPLRMVSLEEMTGLREGISAEALFGADLHSYEEGFVGTVSVWTDAEPNMNPVSGSNHGVPAGYEIRWWAPSGHDVVADVWLFADPDSASDFLTAAASARCRQEATAAVASLPTGGRDLEWRNPLDVVQQDLFFARGSRVYRVAVVAPGASEESAASRREGFRLVNALGSSLLRSKTGATERVALS